MCGGESSLGWKEEKRSPRQQGWPVVDFPRSSVPTGAVLQGDLAHLRLSPTPVALCLGCPQPLVGTGLSGWRIPRVGSGRLTVHGDLDGRAAALADGVLHHTAVQVVILHEHTRDGEHLLVWGQEHPRVIEEGLAVLQPGVAGFGAVLV